MKPEVWSDEWKRTITQRNRWFEGVPIYDKLPDGWRVIEHTLTEPSYTCWIQNGSFFGMIREGKPYKQALMWL